MDSQDARLSDWLEAERRAGREPLRRARLIDDLADAIIDELRRRVGRPFRLDELVATYDRGTDWAVDLCVRLAPDDPWAWAPNLAVDTAYARYARFARDVGGGRRIGTARYEIGRIVG